MTHCSVQPGRGKSHEGDRAVGEGRLKPVNVLGGELEPCSMRPLTGYYRTGSCETRGDDIGVHAVCAEMTEEFLEFSKSRGNDLSTPMPVYGFEGLTPGDCWCLCASRWQEAFEAGMAPRVRLESTSVAALEWINLDDLKKHAL